jgi:hypothetical protein
VSHGEHLIPKADTRRVPSSSAERVALGA